MIRRNRALCVKLLALGVLACVVPSGCVPLHESLRAKHAEQALKEEPTEEKKDQPLDVRPNSKAPFFKNSRLSGAWSDQGREIERDLGIQ